VRIRRWTRGSQERELPLAAKPAHRSRDQEHVFTGKAPLAETESSVAETKSKYTLTRICRVEYIKSVETAFEIIAEPNRRAILSLLALSQQSVGEIERQLRMTQPTVSKHLRVLREAGFVEATVDAQRRLYQLKPERFQEVDTWLAQFRRFWSAHVDALERHLDRMHHQPDGSSPPKRKPKEKTTRPKRERNKGETK
jgi:DNA-binding transcriptional ArsR family regulator